MAQPKPAAKWRPNLNWKEIAFLVQDIAPQLRGVSIEKIQVPHRPIFKRGFLLGEWVLRLSNQQHLLLSIQNSRPYLVLGQGKGPKHAPQSTHSPFSLSLAKNLEGKRITAMESVDQERIIQIHFQRFKLILHFMPAQTRAYLCDQNYEIIADSRQKASQLPQGKYQSPPIKGNPKNFSVRSGLSHASLLKELNQQLFLEGFEQRQEAIQKEIRTHQKHSEKMLRQGQTSLKKVAEEADWQYYGDCLKANLHEKLLLNSANQREVMDYASGKKVKIPCDPKLSPQEQVKKFYQLAKRKIRRQEEGANRSQEAEKELRTFEKLSQRISKLIPSRDSQDELEAIESQLGLAEQDSSQKKKRPRWNGPQFHSQQGNSILAGRNLKENQELTFKVARGNDLWLHLRGRPSSHVVIMLDRGKSASLETLLDAAAILLHYSRIKGGGKIEVDYTFRKHVKRIKGSSQVSYTQNKPLTVSPDEQRLKRLLTKNS